MKKHILFVIENRAVPYDKRVWLEALAVKNGGYDVSVISRREKKATKSYERIDGIDVYRHSILCDANGKLSYILEYGSAIFWEIVLALKIYLKKPFHVIHAGNPPDTIFLVAWLFRIFGVKYVFDVHDLSPELFASRYTGKKSWVHRMLVFVEKLSCRTADAIITTNLSYKEILTKRHRLDPQTIFIVRNDPKVLPDNPGPADPAGMKNGTNIILYLGSINPQDGVDILVDVIDNLVKEFKETNFRCRVVGDGHSLDEVKKMTEERDLGRYFDFKGYVYDQGKIREYLSTADICVEPAPDTEINNHSTFIKIMEYMSVNKALVAFDLKENRYSALGSGILVPPGDIRGFATAIKTLLDEPELRRKLGDAGKERIRKELNWDNSVANLKEAYKTLSIPL
jgi:glycosyltransferase involved in cell wall biosynthesis